MPITKIIINNYRCFGAFDHAIPCDSDFAPGVNVVAGPNGSGKTSLINALSIPFNRDPQNSQVKLTASGVRRHRCRDHHDSSKLWSIKVAAELREVGGSPAWNGTIERRAMPDASTMLPPQPNPNDAGRPLTFFTDRCFPMGWPRALEPAIKAPNQHYADQRAFVSGETNSTALKKSGDKIIADARKWLSLTLFDNFYELTESCPDCNQVLPAQFRIRDSSGSRLVEGSDGIAHFLYMIFEIRKHPWPTTFLIEEPDVFMHPGMQRSFLSYALEMSKAEHGGHQFFITTHSPYLLDFAVQHPGIHLYRLEQARLDRVQRIQCDEEAWQLLMALGHRPADVMHANGIIWVEGPSDKIYVKAWLDKLAAESPNPIRWGLDADIVWYGGANIKHVNVKFVGPKAPRCTSFLRQFNPNCGFVVDSDSGNEGAEWMTKYKEENKQYCESQNLFFWLAGNGLQGATIESYVRSAHWPGRPESWPPRGEKVDRATEYAKWIEADSNLNFTSIALGNGDLGERIAALMKMIRQWGEREAV